MLVDQRQQSQKSGVIVCSNGTTLSVQTNTKKTLATRVATDITVINTSSGHGALIYHEIICCSTCSGVEVHHVPLNCSGGEVQRRTKWKVQVPQNVT